MSNVLSPQLPNSEATEIEKWKRMSPAWALAWKQFADLTQSFIVLSAASILMLILAAWWLGDQTRLRDQSGYYWVSYNIVAMFTCGFALVACFVSFVTEFESRTRDFLSSLPVSSFLVGVVLSLIHI